ncbi:HAD family hydrolase [Parapedobacter sp. GCM10030251]|uniref:HAD family hydrolase n=1 Tax=Parapedobacter sp. GCM10030251 TaxID=3273419 RepID=UPI003623E7AE
MDKSKIIITFAAMDNYAVIFDMDGVIAHTNPHHAEAFKLFFDKYNVSYTDQEFEDHMYGKHNDYIMRYFFKRALSDAEIQHLADEKEALFREIYHANLTPIAGLPEFLSALKSQGFRLGVATSAPRANLDFILDGLALRPLMDSALSSEDVNAHKPDPEIYVKSAENLGVRSEDCVIFEDSFSGVTAATRAGAKVVGVLTSHTPGQLPPCQAYIHDYRDIDVARIHQLLTASHA